MLLSFCPFSTSICHVFCVQLMNAADSTIDVCDFDRHTVLAVMRYLYTADVDIEQPLVLEVCRFATRYCCCLMTLGTHVCSHFVM